VTAQALPKTNELIDKINSFFSEYRRPTEFEIKLLKKEAENLKKVDYCDYYQLLGQIALFENNKKSMVSHFENAIKLNPNDFVLQYNYAISLQNRGLIKLAVEQAKQFLGKYPNNASALICLVDALILSCRLNEAMNVLNTIDDKTSFNPKNINNLTQGFKIFNQAGLSDDEAQQIQELSCRLIDDKNLYVFEHEYTISENILHYIVYIDVPIKDIFDLNWELAGVLAERLNNMRCEVLNFQYSSVEILKERREYERHL
jgi:predicted Zn-dependent protease